MTDSIFTYEARQLQSLAACALECARALGATDAVVRVSEGNNLTVSVLNGEVDVMQRSRSKQIAITIYVDGRSGSSASADLSRAAIETAAGAAFQIASFTAPDPFSGPVESEYLARGRPDLDLFHRWDLSSEDAIAIANEIETAALVHRTLVGDSGELSSTAHQLPTRLASGGSTVSTHHGQFILATSRGFSDGYPQSVHNAGCSVIAANDSGMQNGSWSSTHRSASCLEDFGKIGRTAATRAVAQLGARRLPTARSPVLFEAPVATTLVGAVLGAIAGDAQYRRQSWLLDSIGTRVMAEHLTLEERPRLPTGLVSAPFDREGVATADADIVSDGMLKSYLLDQRSSRKLGLPLTGHAGGARNVRLRSRLTLPHEDFAALIRRLGTGLVVTRIMGGGVNPITGDYSQGVAGFWAQGGELRYPVQEITIAGNLREMLDGILAVGTDHFVQGTIETGSILIDEMQIAGL